MKKRIFFVVLVFMLSMLMPAFASAGAVQGGGAVPQTTKYSVTVALKSVKLLSNNHVGNEWSTLFTVNGKKVTKSLKLKLKTTDTLSIVCKATEKDSSPDIGKATWSIKVKNIKKGTVTYTKTVTVTENKGRYKGNKAKWRFTFTVKR